MTISYHYTTSLAAIQHNKMGPTDNQKNIFEVGSAAIKEELDARPSLTNSNASTQTDRQQHDVDASANKAVNVDTHVPESESLLENRE